MRQPSILSTGLLAFALVAALPAMSVAEAVAEAAADSAAHASDQASDDSADDSADNLSDPAASFFASTTVTATGSEVDVFDISTPVTVISRDEIERLEPENAVDLLRSQPGVDVNGVGPNQARPIIRGQRGLRVLFLENGLRLNNARRQTDFGEISGLVSLDQVDAVEVVRGPASVLYGTDAIGGVLNLVTHAPIAGSGFLGSAGLRYGTSGDLTRAEVGAERRGESFSVRLGASYRDVDDYESASGRFGEIDLDDETVVNDTGVQDDSFYADLGYQLDDNHRLRLRWSRYRADQTGFGFVEPELFGDSEDFRIRILYPFQSFDRYALSWVGVVPGIADSAEVQLYQQSNERELVNDIDINIGVVAPGAPPSSVESDTLNFTDLDTLGLRAELSRGLGDRQLLTWGVEAWEDDSFNTDSSVTTTTIRVPFPPFAFVDVGVDTVANAPNARHRSYGVFVQDEIVVNDRLTATLGARYQDIATRAEATPGWDTTNLDFDDDAFVGAFNLIYELRPELKLIASYGTAFRAPNIVERLFNGPTPEGIGFQLLNPDLVSEESDNVDLGLKYRRGNAVFELIYFRTDVDDGIVQDFLTEEEIAQLPQQLQDEIVASGAESVVRQVNADSLRYEGFETVIGYRHASGFTVGGNFTKIDADRLDSENPPTGQSFSDKLNAYARYERPGGRWWAEYRIRHNGEGEANLQAGEAIPPVGETLPSFTVHALAGGVTLFERASQQHTLGLVIDNLTDELYAEFSNATFFRPQPKRSVSASYRVRF
jgi:outer membrane receptor protein involved in Fe transport